MRGRRTRSFTRVRPLYSIARRIIYSASHSIEQRSLRRRKRRGRGRAEGGGGGEDVIIISVRRRSFGREPTKAKPINGSETLVLLFFLFFLVLWTVFPLENLSKTNNPFEKPIFCLGKPIHSNEIDGGGEDDGELTDQSQTNQWF